MENPRQEHEWEDLMRAPGSERASGYVASKSKEDAKVGRQRKKDKNGPVSVTQQRSAAEWYGEWLQARLEGETEFSAPELIDEAVGHFMKEYSRSKTLLVDHASVLVRSYVSRIIYQLVHGLRPSDNWVMALEVGGSEWFEHADGIYRNVATMTTEDVREVIREREAQVEGQLRAIEELKKLAGNADKRNDAASSDVETEAGIFGRGTAWGVVQSPHGASEYTGFCWYCGGLLHRDPSGYPPHHGPICAGCGTEWVRAYSNTCPDCGGSFVHVHRPDSASGGERVEHASGSCWCDACSFTYAYDWVLDKEGSSAHIVIAGVRGTPVEGQARDIINPDS